MSFSYISLYNINQMPIIIMKQILYLTIIIAALGLYACDNDNEPEVPEIPLEVLPSDLSALKIVYDQLGAGKGDYPVEWELDDRSTWKNVGIEFDTITDEENQKKFLAISSITVCLTREGEELPRGLLSLKDLKDLKIYGCTGSRFDGRFVPSTVKLLLVDRLNPDDPGYILGVPIERDQVIINMKASFNKLVIHGVDMKALNCMIRNDASIIDLSHNTLEGDVPFNLRCFSVPANMSYNRYTNMEGGWEGLGAQDMVVPIVQYNLIDNIPKDILKSSSWKKYHENFMGKPGYVAPQP